MSEHLPSMSRVLKLAVDNQFEAALDELERWETLVSTMESYDVNTSEAVKKIRQSINAGLSRAERESET